MPQARPARLAPLLALPLLAAALAGCTVTSDLQRFLDRAQGRVEYADVDVLGEQVDFALTDAPAPPPAEGHLTVVNFTVPAAARSLRLEATVAFDQGPQPLPVALPAPQGQVRVLLVSPLREEGNATLTADGAEVLSVDDPAPGEWGVEVESFGQGSVYLFATVNRPAP